MISSWWVKNIFRKQIMNIWYLHISKKSGAFGGGASCLYVMWWVCVCCVVDFPSASQTLRKKSMRSCDLWMNKLLLIAGVITSKFISSRACESDCLKEHRHRSNRYFFFGAKYKASSKSERSVVEKMKQIPFDWCFVIFNIRCEQDTVESCFLFWQNQHTNTRQASLRINCVLFIIHHRI